MPSSRTVALAVTGVLVSVLAIVVAAGPAAASTTSCRAWASLPARVALHQKHTVVTTELRGTAGCLHRATDNGATASLSVPGGSSNDAEPMRWSHFGATQSVQLYVTLDRSGRYTMSGGNVQLYDSRYERVPWSWASTSMVVKRAAHVVRISARGGVVSGRAIAYSKYGWIGDHEMRVRVQRCAVGTKSWHTLGSVRPGVHGWAYYRTSTSSRYVYRMFFPATAATWGGRSVAVRG